MELNARPLIDRIVRPVPSVDLVYKGYGARYWRDLATEQRKIARESFEAGDRERGAMRHSLEIDGREALLLSRWYDLHADLAETGGIKIFPALFDASGALACDATCVYSAHREWVWRLDEGSGATWFRPSTAKSPQVRRNNDLKRGYLVGAVRMRAIIRTGSRPQQDGAHVWHFITRDPASPIEIIDTGTIEHYERMADHG